MRLFNYILIFILAIGLTSYAEFKIHDNQSENGKISAEGPDLSPWNQMGLPLGFVKQGDHYLPAFQHRVLGPPHEGKIRPTLRNNEEVIVKLEREKIGTNTSHVKIYKGKAGNIDSAHRNSYGEVVANLTYRMEKGQLRAMTYVEGSGRGRDGRVLKVNYAGGDPTLVTSCEPNEDMHCYNSPTCHRGSNNCLSVNKASCETFAHSGAQTLAKAKSYMNNMGSYCKDAGATEKHPGINSPTCSQMKISDMPLPDSVYSTVRRAVSSDEVSYGDLDKRWNIGLVTANHGKGRIKVLDKEMRASQLMNGSIQFYNPCECKDRKAEILKRVTKVCSTFFSGPSGSAPTGAQGNPTE